MKSTEAEDYRVARQLYDNYQKARVIHSRAKREALAEAKELLEPLRAIREEALAACQKSLAGLMKYTTPHPRPGDPVPPL